MNPALRAIIVIVILIGAVVLSSGVAAAAQLPVRTDSSAGIVAWVEQRVTARGLPGTAVAVVRGGDVVHLAGYGVADDAGRAVTPDTPFIIGSASKPFTAVVIGQLVEEGLLSWDEPVWPHLSHLVDDAPDGFEAVTVEQLLTHTAGLSMIFGTAGTVTIHEGPDALDRRVDELLSRRLSGAPGEEFNYSNSGFMLLAAVDRAGHRPPLRRRARRACVQPTGDDRLVRHRRRPTRSRHGDRSPAVVRKVATGRTALRQRRHRDGLHRLHRQRPRQVHAGTPRRTRP
jgi:hypothetical protein